MVFDDDAEYVRFADFAYDRWRGNGLELTDVPVERSIRIASWLFEQTKDQFAWRILSPEELGKVHQSLENRQPFDPANLKVRGTAASPIPH